MYSTEQKPSIPLRRIVIGLIATLVALVILTIGLRVISSDNPSPIPPPAPVFEPEPINRQITPQYDMQPIEQIYSGSILVAHLGEARMTHACHWCTRALQEGEAYLMQEFTPVYPDYRQGRFALSTESGEFYDLIGMRVSSNGDASLGIVAWIIPRDLDLFVGWWLPYETNLDTANDMPVEVQWFYHLEDVN